MHNVGLVRCPAPAHCITARRLCAHVISMPYPVSRPVSGADCFVIFKRNFGVKNKLLTVRRLSPGPEYKNFLQADHSCKRRPPAQAELSGLGRERKHKIALLLRLPHCWSECFAEYAEPHTRFQCTRCHGNGYVYYQGPPKVGSTARLTKLHTCSHTYTHTHSPWWGLGETVGILLDIYHKTMAAIVARRIAARC